MWAMHEKHDDKLQLGKSNRQGILKESSGATKTSDNKSVTFTTVQENGKEASHPELKVKEHLMKDAKAFLDQYTDFR